MGGWLSDCGVGGGGLIGVRRGYLIRRLINVLLSALECHSTRGIKKDKVGGLTMGMSHQQGSPIKAYKPKRREASHPM
jgi:hypothetical protein